MKVARVVYGFTVVELMVVMSIIVLLVSILLPTMSRSHEIARRAVCASRQRQMHMLVIGIAVDEHGELPVTWPAYSDHVSWIPDALFRQFEERVGLEPQVPAALNDARQLDILYCPNRRDWELRLAKPMHRLGFYSLYGRGSVKALPWKGDDPDNKWLRSPRRMSDPGNLIFASDVVEQGTLIPNVTSLPHTNRGSEVTMSGQILDPGELGGEGVNSTYLDGSVSWRYQHELTKHSARTQGDIKGWW
ncbi:MAG: prepilin-type N-terminal cleavage/methylation domain-containing protein [Phycisphaera sp.]|nr:prepilin-type N-terminal cleavage/methylation domain-containing protein [Phycisphaera sp.]